MPDPTPAAPTAPAAPAVTAVVPPAVPVAPVPPPATTAVPAATVPPVAPPATPAAPAVPAALTLKMPDGSILDAKAVERTSSLAATTGLSQDQAQKTLEFANAEVAAYRQSMEAQGVEIRTKTWPAQLAADPEFGGANLPQTTVDAAAARTAFMDPEFSRMLDETGLGNHPKMVAFSAKVGRMLRGDTTFVPGNGGNAPPAAKSAAQVLYGDTAAQASAPSLTVG